MASEARQQEAQGPADGPPDEVLALRSGRGDLAAFEALARRYQARLYGYALRMIGDAHEAEDLTQETLLRLHRAMGRYDPTQPFAPWAFGIAAHVCRDWLRWRRRRREETTEAPEAAEPRDSPLELSAAAEERQRVAQAVRRLPRKYREVIVLHYVDGMSYEQVAMALGLRPPAARRRALRARQMLQRYLGEHRP